MKIGRELEKIKVEIDIIGKKKKKVKKETEVGIDIEKGADPMLKEVDHMGEAEKADLENIKEGAIVGVEQEVKIKEEEK